MKSAGVTSDPNMEGWTVYDLFARQARAQGDKIACSHLNESMTYAQLDHASLRVATVLRDHGARAGQIIPVLGSRCLEMVVCLLSVSRLGACFVPIDLESWSQDRIQTVLDMTEANVVIVAGELPFNVTRQVLIKVDRQFLHSCDDGFMSNPISPPQSKSELAYIIFTSGTTGKPKGVMISNHSLVNYVKNGSPETPFNLGVNPTDTVLLLFSVAFDACMGVIFSTVCNGGQLVLSDPDRFIEEAKRCSILPLSPSLLGALGQPELYPNVRAIFLGGESPSQSLVRKWSAPHRNIFNAYGPSEATIACTIARLTPDIPITLGQAMPGCSLLVLDNELKPLTEGELFISGPGLAVGYYKNEKLTLERFINIEGTRFYQSGDLVRQTPQGIVFLGRKDSMVKNRGFLINIDSDVIPALLSVPEVQSAVAFMYRGRLVGAVAPPAKDKPNLRQILTNRYDHFVVPDIIMELLELPINANGKVDIQQLKDQFDEETSPAQDSVDNGRNSNFDVLRSALAACLDVNEGYISGTESFWSLGGNSLSGIKLVSCLQERGYTIPLTDLFSLPSLLAVSEILVPLSKNTSPEHQGPIPITPVQMGMIRSSIRRPLAAYMLLDLRMRGRFSEMRELGLKQSLQALLERHTIFRTVFDMKTNQQVIGMEVPFRWKEVTATADNWDEVYREETTALYAFTDYHFVNEVFRPVNAFCYIRGRDDRDPSPTLLWLVHHSQMDGWSMSVLFRELQALLDGTVLPAAPSFSSYAIAVRTHANVGSSSNRPDPFWRQILDGFTDGSSLNIPALHAAERKNSFSRQNITLDVPAEELEMRARCLGTSSATIFYAAWALLLSEYTSADRVIFGSAMSGRTFPVLDIANVVGPLINFVLFPVDVNGQATKDNLLRQIRDLILQIGDHQTSAASAVETLVAGSFSSFFNTALFLEHELPPMPNLPWTITRTDFPEFDVTAYIKYSENEVQLQIVSDDSKYDSRTIYGMLHHFRNLIFGILDPRTSSVADTRRTMMDTADLLRLTSASTSPFESYNGPPTLKAALEEAADRWPYVTAIESATCSLTYSDLDEMANNLALQLTDLIKPRQSVVVLADGSAQWLICVVAIMKLAAVYVPLDTKLPPKRVDTIVRAVNARICLVPNPECETVHITSDICNFPAYRYLQPTSKQNLPRLERIVQPTDFAYTIFTSGSTGTPKGVSVTHEAVVSYLAYPPARMHAAPGRRHAQMFSPGFDVNMAEIFGTLCYGATLVLKDPHDPYQHLSRVQATMITPSFLSVCKPQDYPNLDTILFAGEAVPQALSDRWSGGRKVYNSYGPCECTIGALFKLLHPGEPVTLGRPIPRVGVYLLDRHNCPVPQGVIGEICLSGLQVMKGYLGEHMKEVSAEKFVPDPFVHGQRMYKTGDLAMWTPTMDVVFLGRRDNQIKVRGFRVELEEVENAILSADPAVKQAAAVVVGDSIHAFVSPENVDLSKLGPSLQTLIPAYACPSRIVTLPCLPLTSNQKLDRKALSKLEIGTSTTNVQSLSGTEQLVADVWRETANIALDVNIGRSDDYMTVGGNSLGQIRVAQTLSRRFGFPVPLIMVLKNTILSELAHALDQYMEQCKTEDTPATSVDSFDDSGSSPRSELSYVEQELYLLQSLSKSSPTFNIACTFELQGDVNINFLVEAIKSVVATHGVLNTCYTCIEGTVTHKVCQNPFHALQRREHDSEEFDLQAWVDTPFDLHSDRLLKVAILEKQSKVVVSTVQHHTVSDYTSLGIFFTAVGLAYERIISDAQSDSPDYRKPNSNRVRETWNGWKNHSLQDDVSYWKAQYEDRPSLPLSNIYDLPLPDVGDFQSILIPGPSETVTLAHCLGAVALAMSRATGANDFVVCIPYDRREDAGNEHMLGCFLDRLPVRLTLTEDIMNQPASLYSYAESRLHESLSHAIPYKDIIDAVGDAARFDIMLTYHRREDALQNKLRLPGITVTELPIRPKGAKFPVLFEFTDTSSGLRCDVEYMTRLVTDEVIGGITDVIAGILGSPLSALQDTTHLIVREVHKVKPPSPQNDNRTATSEDLHLVQEAFAIALETEINSVNVDHTYNELGGSPIVSVRIQWVLKQKGYEVDLKDIFVGRTPKAIAARLRPQSIEQVGYVI